MIDSNLSKEQLIQENEYSIPYHYQDIFAPGQSIEKISLYETIIKLLALNKESKILDIGCGDGRFCYFAKDYSQVSGVDFSERALHWATAFNPECLFYQGILQKLKLDTYDGLVCIEVLEHIPEEELDGMLRKMSKLIMPGGKIIFTVPSKNQPLSNKHYRHYDEASLNKLLSQYFCVEIIGYGVISSLYKRLNSILNIISLLFYSERICWMYPNFVKKMVSLKKNFWNKHLAFGEPSKCSKLMAICEKK